ncbi:uncharacterized protein [Asterias amurensis]|uniref:uncharacterized protein n=1 Tax=Asterias amurensis TaxID=7602 RepID=UPI003AB455B4
MEDKVDKLLPIKRQWINADQSASSSEQSFVIVSYNILADCHVTSETYPYLLKGYRTMDERHPQLMMELNHHGDADMICLQEVNGQYFQETLHPALTQLGYEGIHCNKAHGIDEGSATFYKKSRFKLDAHRVVYFKDQVQENLSRMPRPLPSSQSEAITERTLKETVTMFLRLRCKETGRSISVGNIHPYWRNDVVMDVITLQIAYAINTLVDIADDTNSALILCGDFNTQPTMPAYQLLQDGQLNEESVKTLTQFRITSKSEPVEDFTLVDVMSGSYRHPIANFQSAYKQVMGNEVPFSQFHDTVGLAWKEKHQPGFQSETSSNQPKGPKIKALDYIWFSSQTLDCEGALQMVDRDVIDSLYACPNQVFPSDHHLMKARFRFKV